MGEKCMASRLSCFLLITVSAAAILIMAVPVSSGAQENSPDYSGSLWTRSTLTGPWGCARNELAKKGITFKSTVTNIYQGNFTDGRDGDMYWRYSGSADYEMNLDFGKLGLWPRGFL
jgi:carbohydrate-selective porin OprB